MSTNVPALVERQAKLVGILDEQRSKFAEALPEYIKPDAFVRTIKTALALQPELSEVTASSLVASCLKAAQDGLILDGREAALVIRTIDQKKQATYMPMYQGLMKLARNSGQISSLTAQVVYANDEFVYAMGDEERIRHEPPKLGKPRGEPVGVYAIAKLTDGTTIREVMDRDAVLRIGNQGRNGKQYDPKTGANFGEWWRKTAIRRISKYLPRSSDQLGRLAQAIERVDEDFDWSGQEIEGEAQAPAPRKERGGAAARLKVVKPEDQVPAEAAGPTIDHDPETGEIPGDDAPPISEAPDGPAQEGDLF